VLPEKIENISVGDLITLTTDNRKYILIDDYKSNGSYKLTSIDYHQDIYIEKSDLKPLLKKCTIVHLFNVKAMKKMSTEFTMTNASICDACKVVQYIFSSDSHLFELFYYPFTGKIYDTKLDYQVPFSKLDQYDYSKILKYTDILSISERKKVLSSMYLFCAPRILYD
jgi:hypothetical protein